MLALASEWPQFRGPNASGVSDAAKLPAEFGPDRNVVWKTPMPPGNSSPAIAGDKIFLTAIENNGSSEESVGNWRAQGWGWVRNW